jgi:hypothetical protein
MTPAMCVMALGPHPPAPRCPSLPARLVPHRCILRPLLKHGTTAPAAALQFTLVAQASAPEPSSAQFAVVFELKTRYSYITCGTCGNLRLPLDQQQAAAAGADSPAHASPAACPVRSGEAVCPVHLQAVYRLRIGPHTDGQVNNLTKVRMKQAQRLRACNPD